MKKRGQVTIFIIVAILVIGAVALFLTLRGGIQKGESYSPEVAPIKNFVDECLDDSLEEVISIIGFGGGHYVPSNEIGITYYVIDGMNYMPSQKEVESEISTYVSRNLILCLRNFIDFSEYEITKGEMITMTTFDQDKVFVEVNYPLTIKKGESSSQIEDFETEVPVRLGVIYSATQEIVNSSLENICLSCIADISFENQLFVNMFDYDNETVVFLVKDENSEINGKPFEWVFANVY